MLPGAPPTSIDDVGACVGALVGSPLSPAVVVTPLSIATVASPAQESANVPAVAGFDDAARTETAVMRCASFALPRWATTTATPKLGDDDAFAAAPRVRTSPAFAPPNVTESTVDAVVDETTATVTPPCAATVAMPLSWVSATLVDVNGAVSAPPMTTPL
jgi:hypothetical protein